MTSQMSPDIAAVFGIHARPGSIVTLKLNIFDRYDWAVHEVQFDVRINDRFKKTCSF